MLNKSSSEKIFEDRFKASISKTNPVGMVKIAVEEVVKCCHCFYTTQKHRFIISQSFVKIYVHLGG